MASVAQLGYLGLGVSDVDEWERFATQILGLETGGRDRDGSLFLRMDEYDHRFLVHPEGADDLACVGWEVTDERALEAMTEQLKAAGVMVARGTEVEAEARRVRGLIRFQDPSGIASEVYYGPLLSFERPFRSSRAISGFETGVQGLGHIVVAVNDFDQSLSFYRDVLGMRVSDFIPFEIAPGVRPTLAFLRCNPRHHSLAIMAASLDRKSTRLNSSHSRASRMPSSA